MKDVLAYRSARNLIETLGGAKAGETVLILTDFKTNDISQTLLSVVYGLGATPILISMPPTSGHGGQLPEAVGAAMAKADLVVAPTTHNIAHTKARHAAQANGARIIILPESDENILHASGLGADFVQLRPKVERLGQLLTEGSVVRATTQAGTDFTVEIAGRNGRALTGFANTTDISAAHCIESSIAPVEGTGNGRLVIDGSIPGVGLVDEPVIVDIENGNAVAIEGGRVAEQFRDLLASLNDDDRNIYKVAEFGIGMNPECVLENSMLSDEGVFGTVHVALGTNLYMGGTTLAKGHYDMVFKEATVEIDNHVVLDGRKLHL